MPELSTASSGRMIQADSGNNCRPTTRKGWFTSNRWQSIRERTDMIYAGTWYLPYKSTDGGKTWRSIKNGIIDDSDIFAIDIDPRDPNHIIASACSGIYESKTAGESWQKVQGIPSQSRRTRAILQHPSVPGLVFAGTTEGFWRSERGGDADSWMVTTSRQLEINSITVHPSRPDMIYIGTNNYGVMVSIDGGKSFHAYQWRVQWKVCKRDRSRIAKFQIAFMPQPSTQRLVADFSLSAMTMARVGVLRCAACRRA